MKILDGIIEGGGLMSLIANEYKSHPFEIQSQFIREVKEHLVQSRLELIDYYGIEIVVLLEKY